MEEIQNLTQSFENLEKKLEEYPLEGKDLILNKLNTIIKALKEYEDRGIDVKYIEKTLTQRIDNISSLIDNKALNSKNFIESLKNERLIGSKIEKLLSKENLLQNGVLIAEKGDIIGSILYEFNIKPEKALVDGNTNINIGEVEFLTKEATLVIRLKQLEKSGIINFGKDNIPTINEGKATLIDSIELIQIMKDFIGLQLAKPNLEADKKQDFLKAQTNLNNLKIQIPKGPEQEKMMNNFRVNLNSGLDSLPEIKNGTITQEQRNLIDGITDWFDKRSSEEKVLIIALITTVGILGIIYLGPILVPFLEGAALKGFLSFIAIIEKFPALAFLVGFIPGSGAILRSGAINLPGSAQKFGLAGNYIKDALPIFSGFLPKIGSDNNRQTQPAY